MNTATHFKLGLFALIAITGLVVVVLALGVKSRTPTVAYHTYFDETVQGLDVGAAVDYRGRRIGSVGDIAIASDHRHVDVRLDIRADTARRLELDKLRPNIRAQLGTQGITGVKLVDLDWFPAEPLPDVGIPTGANYIASRPSLLKLLADQAENLGQRVPALLAQTADTMDKLGRVFDDIRSQHLAGRVGDLVDQTRDAVGEARSVIRRIDSAQLPEQTIAAIQKLEARAESVLARLDGVGDLVTSARHAIDSVGTFGRSATGSTGELEETIRALGDAARSFRELVDEIQRDPDMLVKGRARTGKR